MVLYCSRLSLHSKPPASAKQTEVAGIRLCHTINMYFDKWIGYRSLTCTCGKPRLTLVGLSCVGSGVPVAPLHFSLTPLVKAHAPSETFGMVCRSALIRKVKRLGTKPELFEEGGLRVLPRVRLSGVMGHPVFRLWLGHVVPVNQPGFLSRFAYRPCTLTSLWFPQKSIYLCMPMISRLIRLY